MSGFKKFLLEGNLVSLATAVIIATAFGAVVNTKPSAYSPPHPSHLLKRLCSPPVSSASNS